MQKSGSGWFFNLTNDLLVATGNQDVRQIRERYHLHPFMKYYNCNIGRPILPKVAILTVIHYLGNTFVVKTHSFPSPSLRYQISRKIVKATYIYRDPRDAVVSAYEHGKRLRSQGQIHSFATLKTLEEAILRARNWLKIWEAWNSQPNTLLVRYEDLLSQPENELRRLANFLNLTLAEDKRIKIISAYQPESNEDLAGKGLHFNKGVIGRYRSVMTSHELKLCTEQFGDYLNLMGYET
jgi:hypothetical protein